MFFSNFFTDYESDYCSIDFNSGEATSDEEYILINLDENTGDEDNMTSSETVLDRLIKPLEEAIEKIEENRKVHYREKLSFRAFVRLLLYYFVMAIDSGRLLVTDRKTAPENLDLFPIKRSTFFDAEWR